MKNQELISLLTSLSNEFHSITSGEQVDGILKSISITLDKALYQVSNNLPLTNEVRIGIEKSTQVAVKLFEGSGIDDDLFDLRVLKDKYSPDSGVIVN